jgi:hypothetical protein
LTAIEFKHSALAHNYSNTKSFASFSKKGEYEAILKQAEEFKNLDERYKVKSSSLLVTPSLVTVRYN